MGGQREVNVPKSQSKSAPALASLGDIRIHENNGEVHFHDDKAKLKVAVPVAEWWREWQKLKAPNPLGVQWVYVDIVNSTLLSIISRVDIDQVPAEVILSVNIQQIQVADNFKKIQEFTKGAKK